MLAHHMVQIAERASILDQEADKILLIERANHLWDTQAMFEWDLVDVSSCNSSIVSDDDSIGEEGNSSGFNSPSWEGVAVSDPTEPNPPSTLQRPHAALDLLASEPDPLLNYPSTTCQLCDGPLNAKFETLCDSCCRYSLPYATGMLEYEQAPLDIPAPSIYSVSEADKQLDVSQRTAKGSLQSPVDDTSFQSVQQTSCLSCGVTTMWLGLSFCLTCMLKYDPRQNLFDAFYTTSSAGDYIEPTSGFAVPKNPGQFCCQMWTPDILSVRRTNKTPSGRKENFVKGWSNIQDWEAVAATRTQFDAYSSTSLQGTEVSPLKNNKIEGKLIMICQHSANDGTWYGQEPHDRSWAIESCESFKPHSSFIYYRDKKNMTDNRVLKRKNLLV